VGVGEFIVRPRAANDPTVTDPAKAVDGPVDLRVGMDMVVIRPREDLPPLRGEASNEDVGDGVVGEAPVNEP